MAKMIHSMIRVLNEEKTLQFYQDVLNLREKRRLSFESFALIYLGNEETDFELELTVNFSQEEAYQMGNGYGHLAFAANNIEMLHQNAVSLGYRPNDVKEFHNGDELVAKFFFINDPDGYSIEVIERSEVYR